MNAYCERSNPPSTGICLCHKGYIIISENGHRECFKAAATINDVCTYNEQCMITLSTESECLNNRCQCKEGTHYVQRENSCYKTSSKYSVTITSKIIFHSITKFIFFIPIHFSFYPKQRLEIFVDLRIIVLLTRLCADQVYANALMESMQIVILPSALETSTWVRNVLLMKNVPTSIHDALMFAAVK